MASVIHELNLTRSSGTMRAPAVEAPWAAGPHRKKLRYERNIALIRVVNEYRVIVEYVRQT